MKIHIVLLILVLTGYVHEGKTLAAIPSILGIELFVEGTIDTIIPNQNGELILSAKKGKGVGSSIKYMPEWEAFGFFREGNHIEWGIQVGKTRKYTVYLEWSAEGGVVGNPYVFTIGKRRLEGKNKDSGSWEIFLEEPIGVLKVKKGIHKVVFRPGDDIEKGGGMLDVKTIRLVPQ